MDPLRWMGAVRMRIHNNAYSGEKVHLLLSSHIKIHHLFRTVLDCSHLICAYFSPDSDETTFSLEKAIGDRVQKVTVLSCFFLFTTNTQLYTSQDVYWWTGLEWWGLLVDYGYVSSSFWTLILMAPIHCRGSIGDKVMLNFQQMFIFAWTIPLSNITRTSAAAACLGQDISVEIFYLGTLAVCIIIRWEADTHEPKHTTNTAAIFHHQCFTQILTHSH